MSTLRDDLEAIADEYVTNRWSWIEAGEYFDAGPLIDALIQRIEQALAEARPEGGTMVKNPTDAEVREYENRLSAVCAAYRDHAVTDARLPGHDPRTCQMCRVGRIVGAET